MSQDVTSGGQDLSRLLVEERIFQPSDQFTAGAVMRAPGVYERAVEDPEAFWAEMAGKLDWFKKWDKVLQWDPPHAQWFVGGKLNACYNCVDRHIKNGKRNQAAII